MKNTQTIFNIGFGIAIAVLLTLQLTTGSSTSSSTEEPEEVTTEATPDADTSTPTAVYIPDVDIQKLSSTELPIGHINIEKFTTEYKFLIDSKRQMEKDYIAIQSNLSATEEILNTKYNNLMRDAQTGMISESQATYEMEALKKEMYKHENNKQKRSQQFANKQMTLQNQLQSKIDDYLKRYSDEFQFSYIIGSGPGTGTMWASESLDVTDEILKGMNSEYANAQ